MRRALVVISIILVSLIQQSGTEARASSASAGAARRADASTVALWLFASAGKRVSQGTLTVDVHQKVQLTARVVVNGKIVSGQADIQIFETPGKKVIQDCRRTPCAYEAIGYIESRITYRAVLFIPTSGAFKQLQSSPVTVNWQLLTMTIDACQPATPPSTALGPCRQSVQTAGLPLEVTVQLPQGKKPGPTWQSVIVQDTTTGKQIATCAPGKVEAATGQQPQCMVEQKYFLDPGKPKDSVKKVYAAYAVNKNGERVGDSLQLSVAWEPWPVDLEVVGKSSNPVNVTFGTTVKLHAVSKLLRPAGAGLTFQLLNGNSGVRCDRSTDKEAATESCDFSQTVTQDQAPGEQVFSQTYTARVVALDGQLAGQTDSIVVDWRLVCERQKLLARQNRLVHLVDIFAGDLQSSGCPLPMVALTVQGASKVGAGTPVALHLQQTNEKVQLLKTDVLTVTRQGSSTPLAACPAGVDSCTVTVKETSPVTDTLTAILLDAAGEEQSPHASPVQVTWDSWKVTSVTASASSVNVGTSVTITATSNYPLPAGYVLRVQEDTGSSVGCSGGGSTTCSWGRTETAASTHTFTGAIYDPGGSRVDANPPTVQVKWVAVSNCTLSGDHVMQVNPTAGPSGPPVIVCMAISANANVNFTVSYKDPLTISVPSFVDIGITVQLNVPVAAPDTVVGWLNDANGYTGACGGTLHLIYDCDIGAGSAGQTVHASVRTVHSFAPGQFPGTPLFVSPTVTITFT